MGIERTWQDRQEDREYGDSFEKKTKKADNVNAAHEALQAIKLTQLNSHSSKFPVPAKDPQENLFDHAPDPYSDPRG